MIGRSLRVAILEFDTDGQRLFVVLLGLLPLPLLLRHHAQLVIGRSLRVAILEFDFDGQRLFVVLLGLLPLPLLLRHAAQLVIGPCLRVAILEFDIDGQRLFVVLLGLLPLPLLLRHAAQLVIQARLSGFGLQLFVHAFQALDVSCQRFLIRRFSLSIPFERIAGVWQCRQ